MSLPSEPSNFNRKFPSLYKALQIIWKRERSVTEIIIHLSNALGLMIVGHLLFSYLTTENLIAVFNSVNSEILYYIAGGFIAQMIDGALGMAYGVTATTFLLSVGITPAAASASVHASEVFTSGVSGYMHLKFGNVNSKLFKTLVIPGIIGAVLGAYVLSSLEEYSSYIKPIVSIYTLFLGVIIIRKALIKRMEKRQLKRVGLLALFGGYLDSIGGGGWGPIVSSTLIASGRHPKYTIGSVNLTEFFVSLEFKKAILFMDDCIKVIDSLKSIQNDLNDLGEELAEANESQENDELSLAGFDDKISAIETENAEYEAYMNQNNICLVCGK